MWTQRHGKFASLPPIAGSSSNQAPPSQIDSHLVGYQSQAVSNFQLAQSTRDVTVHDWQDQTNNSLRALLEETVRLRGEIRAVSQHNEAEKQQTQDELNQLRDEIRKVRGVIVNLEHSSVSSADRIDQQNAHTTSAFQACKAIESKLATIQQNTLLRNNELASRFDRQQQTMESVIQELQHTKQSITKTHENLEGIIGITRQSIQAQVGDVASKQTTMQHHIDEIRADKTILAEGTHQQQQHFIEQFSNTQRQLDHLHEADTTRQNFTNSLAKRLTVLESTVQELQDRTSSQFLTQKETFQQTAEQVQERLASLNGNIEQLQSRQNLDMEHFSSRIDSLYNDITQRVEEVRQDVMEALQTLRLQLTQQIATERKQRLGFEQDARTTISGKLSSIEADRQQSVSALEDMVQRTKTQAAEAFTKFENALFISEDSLTAKISDVEKVLQAEIVTRTQAVAQLTSQTTELDKAIKGVVSSHSAIQDQIVKNLNDEVEAVRMNFETKANSSHSTLKRKLDDFEVQLRSLVSREANRNTAHQRNAASISTLLPRVTAIEEDIQLVRDRATDQLDTQVKYTRSQFDMLQRALALKLDIPDHEQHVKEMFQRLGANEHLIAEVEDRIADIQQALDSQEALVGETINHTQAVLQSELESMWRNQRSVQEDLRKLERQQGALSLGLRIRENKTPAVMEEINDDISGSFSTPINDELDLESEDSKEKEDSDEGEQQEQERENESEHGEDHHTNELGNHRSQDTTLDHQQTTFEITDEQHNGIDNEYRTEEIVKDGLNTLDYDDGLDRGESQSTKPKVARREEESRHLDKLHNSTFVELPTIVEDNQAPENYTTGSLNNAAADENADENDDDDDDYEPDLQQEEENMVSTESHLLPPNCQESKEDGSPPSKLKEAKARRKQHHRKNKYNPLAVIHEK